MPDVPHLNKFLRFLSIILICTVLCGGCKPNTNLRYFFLLVFLGTHVSLPSETVRNEAISVPRDCSFIKYLFTYTHTDLVLLNLPVGNSVKGTVLS